MHRCKMYTKTIHIHMLHCSIAQSIKNILSVTIIMHLASVDSCQRLKIFSRITSMAGTS